MERSNRQRLLEVQRRFEEFEELERKQHAQRSTTKPPPCTKASTQNGTDRDLDEATQETLPKLSVTLM